MISLRLSPQGHSQLFPSPMLWNILNGTGTLFWKTFFLWFFFMMIVLCEKIIIWLPTKISHFVKRLGPSTSLLIVCCFTQLLSVLMAVFQPYKDPVQIVCICHLCTVEYQAKGSETIFHEFLGLFTSALIIFQIFREI